MAYGQILGPQLDPEFDPEALRGLGAENRVLKVRTNSPFLFSFIYIKIKREKNTLKKCNMIAIVEHLLVLRALGSCMTPFLLKLSCKITSDHVSNQPII